MARFLPRALALTIALAAGLPAPARAETVGDFGGVIFGDTNASGAIDAGETGLGGVTIYLDGNQHFERTTDARGRFSFPDIPVGEYSVRYAAPDGWIVFGITGRMWDSVVIDESPRYSDVRIPAVRNLQETLQASMFFEHDTYQVGETAQLTVVLTNLGTTAIAGLTARCMPGGPGWGPLAEGGPGITLPPEQATIVRATVSVPESASRFGFLQVFCTFRTARHPERAAVTDSVNAEVPGVPGAGRGRIFHDIDDDYHPDEGEAVSGVTVEVTDPDTGVVVARPVTDASGVFVVNDLPATKYDARIAGPWKPRSDIFGFQLPVVADEPVGDAWLRVVPGSAEDKRPNLRASAAFEKPVYNSDDMLRVRLTVTNFGDAPAVGVRASLGGRGPGMAGPSMGELSEFGPGTRIEAGATRVFEIEGTIWKPQGAVIFSGRVEAAGYDVNYENNRFGAVATVIATRGTYAGVLYGDADDDGVVDPGEEFSGIPIDLSGGTPHGEYRVSTNERGEFAFLDIPTGRYSPRYHIPDGWYLPFGEFVVVDEGQQARAEVRAVRPPDRFLEPSIAFTKKTYAVGEVAHLTITLTNRGPTDLTGITAFCSGPGNGNEIYSVGPGWGAIGEGGSGVAVRAGETARFDVWTVIPEGGFEWGYVSIGCWVGAPPVQGSPSMGAEAKVPGGVGTAGGVLFYDRNSDDLIDGEGVPDTKVVLLDKETDEVVARAVTDAGGRFRFQDAPAGRYDVLVVGPWKIVDCWCGWVFAGKEIDIYRVGVVPGAVQPDPDAPPDQPPPVAPDESPPVPQAAIAATLLLASTGISVIGLMIGGLTLLAIGLGTLLVRRRRPRV